VVGGGISKALVIAISALVAATVGGLWGMLASWLKKYFLASEVIVTLLLNLVAIGLVNSIVKLSPLLDPNAQDIRTRTLPNSLILGSLLGSQAGEKITVFVIIYFVYLCVTQIIIWWTQTGLRLRATGKAALCAWFSGVDTARVTNRAIFLTGLGAGIVGLNQVFGTGRYEASAFDGWGFQGITVAILGRYRFSGILLASVFLSLLKNFSLNMQGQGGQSFWVFQIVQAVFILVYLSMYRFRLAPSGP
jgi:simple sugar transport system permease protein